MTAYSSAADAGSAGVGRTGRPAAVVNPREVIMASAQPGPDFARKWPREESNLRTRIRSPPLYPLSYGAKGWRTGLEPATTGTTTRGSTN
jgi:hypothetical protein